MARNGVFRALATMAATDFISSLMAGCDGGVKGMLLPEEEGRGIGASIAFGGEYHVLFPLRKCTCKRGTTDGFPGYM